MKNDIPDIYGQWDKKVGNRYAYFQPDLRFLISEREWVVSRELHLRFGESLSDLQVLDIGCGYGGVLTRLIEWGASPTNLTGTELLPERLRIAKRNSADHINWHHGYLNELDESKTFDLILAFTVFSSILDDADRCNLLLEAAGRLNDGGQILIFDLRFNNPKNKNVRKVQKSALKSYLPGATITENKLGLLPPISRFVAPKSLFINHSLVSIFPFLRSHSLFTIIPD